MQRIISVAGRHVRPVNVNRRVRCDCGENGRVASDRCEAEGGSCGERPVLKGFSEVCCIRGVVRGLSSYD